MSSSLYHPRNVCTSMVQVSAFDNNSYVASSEFRRRVKWPFWNTKSKPSKSNTQTAKCFATCTFKENTALFTGIPVKYIFITFVETCQYQATVSHSVCSAWVMCSGDFVFADVLVGSNRKLFKFIMKSNVYRSKVSQQFLI